MAAQLLCPDGIGSTLRNKDKVDLIPHLGPVNSLLLKAETCETCDTQVSSEVAADWWTVAGPLWSPAASTWRRGGSWTALDFARLS